MSEKVAGLKVSSHVLVQLGSELVTDVDQALLECVKNAYDADAPGCRIEIDTKEAGQLIDKGTAAQLLAFADDAQNVQVAIYDSNDKRVDRADLSREIDPSSRVERHLHYTGRVTIEDKGDGISPEKISSSWLVISGSAKRAQGDGPKKPTKRGRTPLGDKGLGRLGTMKLGDILEVESATAADQPLSIARFRWKDCESADTVDQVPVTFETKANTERFKGTRVKVFGLMDTPDWRRKGRIHEIARSLAKLVSPFESTSTFPVSICIDGHDQSLSLVTEQVLNQAIAKFVFSWEEDADGKRELVAKARFMRRLFTAARSEAQRDKANRAFLADKGVGFRAFLDTFNKTKSYEKNDPSDPSCFVEFTHRYPWSDMYLDNGLEIVDPGPFVGAFYFFHIDNRDAEEGSVTGLGVTAELVKSMAGISILRDGFRVRSQGDWLNLSSGMTSGSTYHMRVNNTVGYFALTGAKNFRLVEKSDREGFVENAAYRGFFSMAERCKKFANLALENVRRGLDQYYKELKQADINTRRPSSDPVAVLTHSMAATEDAQVAAKKATEALDAELVRLESMHVSEPSANLAAQALSVARRAVSAVASVQSSGPSRDDLAAVLEKVKFDREEAQEQLLALYESAAVGLSARGLAHELRTHIGDMRQRMSAIAKASKMGAVDDKTVAVHIKAMRDSCSAILSAASLIDPMLPRSRMLKESFDVADFVSEYLEHRRIEFAREGVQVDHRGGPLLVRMNRSRLLQVFDNLVRNSMYWLKRGQASGICDRPKAISIEVGQGILTVADSGPGVDTKYEDTLFELFVSGKQEAEEGQGLGLFISKQLLAADGCDIQLNSERNPDGRRYRFSIDLGNVRL